MFDPTGLTLGSLLRRNAAQRPHAPALLSDQRCLSWAELDREVDGVAGLLARQGVGAGHAVGFLLNKRPETAIGFLAAARLGAIYVPINFKLAADAIRSLMVSAEVRLLFVERAHEEILGDLGELCPPPERIVAVGPALDHPAVPYADHEGLTALPDAPIDPDAACYYNFTSGTTGRPKGAVTTHRNILINAAATVNALGFGPDDVFLGMFSVFSHPHELFHRSLVTGGPFVISDSFSPRVILEGIARFQVSWMMAVPSFYEMMLDYADSRGAEEVPDAGSLRVLEAGGAPVTAETLHRMERRFKGARFLPVWGSTEATGVAICNGPTDRRPGAAGRVVPGYALRAVDEEGRDVGPGEIGELVLRGDAVVAGYVNNAEETAALFLDGWYRTRDLIRVDEDGFVFFVGRRSEMLKVGGLRVYPLEIEVVLHGHPEVRDVVVVGAEDRLRGEVARAIVLTTPGSALDGRAVRHWCRDRLADYKVPRFVEFWAELPRLPNGKIDKRAVLARPVEPDRDERTGRR